MCFLNKCLSFIILSKKSFDRIIRLIDMSHSYHFNFILIFFMIEFCFADHC